MPGHGVRLAADGRLVLARTSPPEDGDRLRRTLERLRGAAGAGAVEIVEARHDGEHIEVVLAFAGRSPAAPMPAADLAPLAAALAGHLSDLHLRRIAHGAIAPEHVLVDATGSVRLCGFGHGDDAAPSDDVQALGTLVCTLLDGRDRSATADALRLHADRCLVEDASIRPTMAALAASLARIDPGGRAIAALPAPPRPGRRRLIGVAVALVVAAAVALLALPRGSRAQPRPDARAHTSVTSPTTTTTTSATIGQPRRVWPATLEGDGSTWELGGTDDRRLQGDWDCDGVATPALLERPSAAVWVIDAWPVGDELPARYVTSVPGGFDAFVEHDAGCDTLVVRTGDGEVRLALSASARPRSPAAGRGA